MNDFENRDFRIAPRTECTCGTWDSLHESHCAHLSGRWSDDDGEHDAA